MKRTSAIRLKLVHAARISILITLLLLLPSPHGRSLGERFWLGTESNDESVELTAPSISEIRDAASDWNSAIAEVSSTADPNGLFELIGDSGQAIGWAARTLPQAVGIAGYRGPTEALLVLDSEQQIARVRILSSHDTEEHVREVEEATEFFEQFKGLTWGGRFADGREPDIDGVSGATLTSLAMAGGVLKRLGRSTRSLVFDEPLTLEDALSIFPEANLIEGDPVALVIDSNANELGTLVRTGEFVDNEIGYQGPTEMLLGWTTEGKLVKPRLRHSFDNEPYVGYLPQEYSFWPAFTGKTVAELAAMDVQAEGVEGVSGATMTSMAVAYTLPRVAQKVQATGGLRQWTHPPKPPGLIQQKLSSIHWTLADIATFGLLVLLLVLTRTHQMRNKWVRRTWLITVIVVIGLWSGNLISLALIAGWATSGVSWYLAIGLVAVMAVAMAFPPLKRANPYCNQLCPHGALQQLVRPGHSSKRRLRLPAPWQKRIASVPALMLGIAYLLLLMRPSTDVSVLEPFHAYLWGIASWSAIGFAVATIGFSAFVPMGYCRLGCPTGRLIEHVRLKSSGGIWALFDWGAIGLLAIGLIVRSGLF